jgi:hypothetical protein
MHVRDKTTQIYNHRLMLSVVQTESLSAEVAENVDIEFP